MRYNKIRKMDISNGPGVRVSIFMQGCVFNCKNCFNPETHDFNGGKEFSDKTIEMILNLCNKDYIVGLSILGGEPMHPKNIEGTTKLAKTFKEKYPDKNIWVYTGYVFEELKSISWLGLIDVIVDGKFIKELADVNYHWAGSTNQRVIDVQKSLKQNEVILYAE